MSSDQAVAPSDITTLLFGRTITSCAAGGTSNTTQVISLLLDNGLHLHITVAKNSTTDLLVESLRDEQ